MALEPGDHFLLRVKTGDRRYRHCVVVSGAIGLAHKVLTPARQVRVQDFSEDSIDAIIPWDGVTLPRRLAGHRSETFLDVDSQGGRFTEEEIDDTIASAAGRVRRRMRSKSPPAHAIADAKPKDDGDDDDSPGASKGAEPRPKEHTGDVADGEGWYVVTGFGAALSGSAISLKGVEHVILGDMALFMKSKRVCLAVWCRAEDVANRLRELRVRSSGHPSERFQGVDEICVDPAATPLVKEKDKDEVDDLRVLPCHFEKDGRRFRRLQDCEQEYVLEEFVDWPVDGERCIGHSARELRRGDRSWLQHHDEWMTRSGVAKNDRSSHERKVLCTSLHHFATYDRLAIVSLAGCEVINARRELIEFAHQQSPGAPRWDCSEEFMGFKESREGTLIDPKRLAHVAAVRGQKAKILEVSMKADETRAAWLRRGGSSTDAAPGVPSAPGGRKLTAAAKAKAKAEAKPGGAADGQDGR